jgi:hypothetical protein
MTGQYPDPTPLREQAAEIISLADERGVTLRLLGALAFHIHCPMYNYIQRETNRLFTDIDFVAYARQKRQVVQLFHSLDYEYDRYLEAVPGLNRSIFHSNGVPWHTDVFYDNLDFCHKIELRHRLEVDHPTLSLADLVLEKMQIVELNEKDVIDTIILLLEHDIGAGDDEMINVEYLARLLKSDWGFWKTVTTNLKKVEGLTSRYDVLDAADRKNIQSKIQRTLQRIDEEPPTLGWRLRSRVGERVKWYRDVEEVK